MVGGLNEEELQRVTVECNALEGAQDRVEDRTASQVTNTTDILVREDGVLVVVSETTSLLNQGGGKAVSVGLVVRELSRDVVVNIPSILESSRPAENIVPDRIEERTSSLCGRLELGR